MRSTSLQASGMRVLSDDQAADQNRAAGLAAPKVRTGGPGSDAGEPGRGDTETDRASTVPRPPTGIADLLEPDDDESAAMQAAEIRALQQRISALEALVSRDEDVLRKLLALLVEKGLATREEILERIR
jgi:hypothetical protein